MSAAPFDIFLSHNSRDKPMVEALAGKLQDAGLRPWLDKWCLVPGGDWQDELTEGLKACPACAVCVGPAGLGNWENLEFKVALDRLAADRAFRLFYVLLPGLPEPFDAGQLPAFLKAARTWVDMRKGLEDRRALQSLINAVKGVAMGPDTPAEPRNDICPYCGLLAFEEHKSEFFFGREGDIQRLVEKLKESRFLAILGPSGSGKSSVVRAGLVPRLRGGVLPDSQSWKFFVFTPGAQPLAALAVQLSRLDPQRPIHQLQDEIVADGRAFHLNIERALADRPASDRVVWVVDQFEEAFTLCPEDSTRERFFSSLLDAASAREGRSYVLLTMRSDFYSKCAAHSDLATRIADHQFLVGPMDEAGLRDAIGEPARHVGLGFESGLPETILADVAEQPGALPLLQYALLELWQRRRGTLLTLEAYRETGGVSGAIAARAEAVYAAFNPKQQELARQILLRLTQPGEGTDDTRRRASPAELITSDSEAVENILSALTSNRLLTAGTDESTGERQIEIAHEALIRGWPRLRTWIDEDRSALRVQRRLTEAIQEWRRTGRDQDLLYRGARLAQALEWRQTHEAMLNADERAFLDASVARLKAERRASQRRVRIAVGTLILVLVVVSVAAVVAMTERNKAVSLNRTAVSRELAASALTQLEIDPELSVLLAVKAAGESPTAQAEEALRQSVPRLASHVVSVLNGHTAPVLSAQFSRDGEFIVTTSEDATARVWKSETAELICQLGGPAHGVQGASFSPDGEELVTRDGGSEGAPTVWELPSGKELRRLQGAGEEIRETSFSPGGRFVLGLGNRHAYVWDTARGQLTSTLGDHASVPLSAAWSHSGRYIATGDAAHSGNDCLVRIWDPGTATPITELRGHSSAVNDVQFSPDDDFVLSAGRDATVRAWRWDTGTNIFVLRADGPLQKALISPDSRFVLTLNEFGTTAELWETRAHAKRAELRGHTAPIIAAAFSPTSDLIVTASEDKTARIWDADTGRSVSVLKGHTDALTSVSFDPDGTLILTSAKDNTARLWHVGREELTSQFSSDAGGMLWSAFSPDGQIVVSATQETPEAVLWNASSGDIIASLSGHEEGVTCVAFRPDGRAVATASKDHTARLWDAANGRCLATLASHTSAVTRVRFSPDSRFVLTAGEDASGRLWDATTGELVGEFVGQKTPITDAVFSPTGDQVAMASQEGTVARVWSVASGQPIAELPNHEEGVSSIAFSPDGDRLVTTSPDSVGRIWDITSGKLLIELRGHVEHVAGMYGGLNMAAFSPDGQQVVTAGRDYTAHLWDAATGRSLFELRGHTAAVWDAAFSPNGRFVATVSGDGTTRVWDTGTGECLTSIPAFIGAGAMTVSFSPDGRRILATGFDSTARIYSCDVCASLEDLLALARDRLTRTFTPEERQKYLHESIHP